MMERHLEVCRAQLLMTGDRRRARTIVDLGLFPAKTGRFSQ